MKKQHESNSPIESNSYEELFIPKKRGYEELFKGGSIEELSDDTPYSFIHPNKYEIDELLEKNRKDK
ncbi:MAG: hypothetical protein ACRCYC_09920 [Paraclostridium sp.]|uniref:hypothetical protein n=1 Tax=Paraclostridium sp. TaxID=2023273 RepID=UPI003F31A0E1